MANNNNKQGSNNQRPNSNKPTGKKVFDTVVKIGSAVGTAASLAKTISDVVGLLNHTPWYKHYSTSDLVAMNLAFKQNKVYKNTTRYAISTREYKMQSAMPLVAGIGIQFVVPEDDDGWRTGIRLLYQQLQTANSGRVNFSVQDLEKYVLNVRLLTAINAQIQKLYRLTYSFRSTSNAIPAQMINAMGFDFDDLTKRAADLLMFSQRFEQQIRVAFPLNCDLLERTQWLIRSIFADSCTDKPSFYVTFIEWGAYESPSGQYQHDQLYYLVDNDGKTTAKQLTQVLTATERNKFCTYDGLVKMYNQIKNDLLNDYSMTNIAAYMIKAFGDKAFFKFAHADINSQMEVIYDESILNQMQNCFPVTIFRSPGDATGLPALATRTNTTARGYFYYNTQASTVDGGFLKSTLYCGQTATVLWTDEAKRALADRINNCLINWHANKIDSGHVMAITRLTPSKADITQGVIKFGAFGTEVVTQVFAVANSESPESPTADVYCPFAGVFVSGGDFSFVNNAFFDWANFDWAPKLWIAFSDESLPSPNMYKIGEISQAIMDYDVFSQVDGDQIKLYFSYGDQSLLYAGSSQNQSGTRVYGKSTGNKSSKPANPAKKDGDQNKDSSKLPEDKK